MANAYVLNQFPTTYGQALSLLAEMLVSAGWTYQSSGDGLAGYNAAGKVFTGTGSGALGWSNAKAWARLRSPAGRELILQQNNDATARIKYSAAAGFSGGAPSATVTPSATDERYLRGGATDAAPTFGAWFNTNLPLGATVFEGFARGSAPYGFWFGGLDTPQGGARQAFLMFDPVEGAAPEDTDPIVIQVAHTNACAGSSVMLARTGGSAGTWTTAAGGAIEGCFAHMDVARTAFVYVQPHQWAWTTDGRVITGGTVNLCVAGAGNGIVNPFNGKYEAMPMLYTRLQIGATANPGNKGWSTMMRWTGVPRVSFSDTFDNRNWICLGNVWLPWDGTTQPRG